MPREIDIEEIVQAVIAQLGAAASTTTATTQRALDSDNAAPRPAAAAPTPTPKTSTALQILDRLVTLATLEHRLTGIDHVVLQRGAVVTPSARDLLRSRGVAVSYACAAERPPVTVLLGVAGLEPRGAFDPTAFVEALVRDGVAVERVASTGLAGTVTELADQAGRGGRAAVLLTAQPEAAACLANRARGVRAVAGRDATQLRRAIDETAANLLAVDPAAAPAAFRRLISDFARGWPHTAPAWSDVHFSR